jgi:hypothetical protein
MHYKGKDEITSCIDDDGTITSVHSTGQAGINY